METRIQRNGGCAAMAVFAMLLVCSAVISVSDADASDSRMVSFYVGDRFVYVPDGDWTEATASGSALDAGLEWSEGTLKGIIDIPGSYFAILKNGKGELTVAIEVLPVTTIGDDHGCSGEDVVIVVGSKAGTPIIDIHVDGPEGTVVGIVGADELFHYDPIAGKLNLTRDVLPSDVGSRTIIIDAIHEAGGSPISDISSKEVNVTVVHASNSGKAVDSLAIMGVGDRPIVTVIDGATVGSAPNPIYASGSEPVIDWFGFRAIDGGIALLADVMGSDGVHINWGDGTRTNVTVDSVNNVYQHRYIEGGDYAVVMTAYGDESEVRAVAYHTVSEDEGDDDHGWLFIPFLVIALAFVFIVVLYRLNLAAMGVVLFGLLAVLSYVMGWGV